LCPLVKPRAADDTIGQAEGDETILELAHLKRGANQDRDFVERVPLTLQLLDLLADGACLFFRIPSGDHADFLTVFIFGAQRLAEAAFVVRNQVGGGGKNVAGRAIVPLQTDDLGTGKVLLEAQNIVDLGTAPAIDRLIIVTNTADVLRRAPNIAT